jgi:hypothetical protein
VRCPQNPTLSLSSSKTIRRWMILALEIVCRSLHCVQVIWYFELSLLKCAVVVTFFV